MRMIGIGLMGFLLAGIALLLSTMNIIERGQNYVRDLTGEPQLVFEHRTPAMAHDLHTAVILRTNTDHPVLLSGFPAYQSIAFTLPVDARPTSGYLQIDATSQVLDGVEGVLRISIRNTRRGEILLHSDKAGPSLQIPLSPMDFAGNQLAVSLSLQGTGPQIQCGSEDGVAAIVEIETTSALHLTLDRPQQSARDQIHAWGDVVRVAWPDKLNQAEKLRRLVLATQFRRRDLTVVFSKSSTEQGLSTTQLRNALAFFPEVQILSADPGTFAHRGTNVGLRKFYQHTEWRETFKLGAETGWNTPAQLNLDLLLSKLLGGDHWTLIVTLNKRLIFQDHINGARTEYQTLIDLPADVFSAINTLEVLASATTKHDGLCDQGPELVAEMLPGSRFIMGGTPFVDALSELQDVLKNTDSLNVAATSGLTAVDADTASRMLDQVLPIGAEFKPAVTTAHVTVLAAGHATPLPQGMPVWVASNDVTGQGLKVKKLQPGDVLPRTGVSLLITPSAMQPMEVEG